MRDDDGIIRLAQQVETSTAAMTITSGGGIGGGPERLLTLSDGDKRLLSSLESA